MNDSLKSFRSQAASSLFETILQIDEKKRKKFLFTHDLH